MKKDSSQKTESTLKACIVLPTYNEAENIESVTEAIFAQQFNIDTHQIHVIVVDDNSPDGTQAIVKKQMSIFPHLYLITGDKTGLGDAYKRGMSFAIQKFNPDLLIQMDADGQHDANLIPIFIKHANNNFSLVIGSRFIQGGSTPHFSYWRKFISILGNFLIRYLGGMRNVKDCTSGFRCIKADLLPKCDLDHLSTRGYSFQSSLISELIRNGANTIEIPIMFKDRLNGESKLTFRDQIEFLINIVKITFRNYGDFIRYCFVGAVGTIVNMTSYFVLNRYYQIPLEVASIVAIEISIISNFLLNNFWTFRNRSKKISTIRRLINFHIAASVSGVMFYYLFFLFLVTVLGINDIISIIFALTAGTISNYTINSLWTWRK